MFVVHLYQMKMVAMQPIGLFMNHTTFSQTKIYLLTIKYCVETNSSRYKDYWGYEMTMVKELQRVLNFNIEIINAPDGVWGLIDEEGQWVGLIGLASRGEVDFIISDILMSWTRFQVTLVKKVLQSG